MSWVDETVQAFGATIGISGLALDESRRLELILGSGESVIGIYHDAGSLVPEVVLSRACPLPSAIERVARKALRLANFRGPLNWPLQVAADDEQLVLAFRIAERSFMLDALEQACNDLQRLQEQLFFGR